MTRHRKTKRRIYRGGDWFSPSTWFSGSSDKAKSVVNSAESSLGNISNSVSNSFSSLSSYNPFSSSTDSSTSYPAPAPAYSPPVSSTTYMPQSVGGRRRRGHKGRSRKLSDRKLSDRKLSGGKGGLGLTYYATPVSGLKVAEPTYWIKGGTRRRRHTRRHKK